jgi:hypothetical protein
MVASCLSPTYHTLRTSRDARHQTPAETTAALVFCRTMGDPGVTMRLLNTVAPFVPSTP